MGLYYYRARWYDPVAGRFVSDDPVGFAAGDANLGRYVGNGPNNSTDPSGLEKVEVEADGTVWVYPESWWFGIDYDDSRFKVGKIAKYTTTPVKAGGVGAKYHLISTGKTRVGIDGKSYPIFLHYGHFEQYVRSYDFVNIRPDHVNEYISKEGFSVNRTQNQYIRSSGFERTQMDQYLRSYMLYAAYNEFLDAIVDEAAMTVVTYGTLRGLSAVRTRLRRVPTHTPKAGSLGKASKKVPSKKGCPTPRTKSPEWKSRRTFQDGDSGLKDHARRHSNLPPKEYLAKGKLNVTQGKRLKGGGKYPEVKYWIRKTGDNQYSMTIVDKKGKILSIDTWQHGATPMTKSDIIKGLEKSGVTPPKGFWEGL